MKNIIMLFLVMFASVYMQAQSYFIDFSASGISTTLDSVYVKNLTQLTSLTLSGNDTLHLLGTTEINELIENQNHVTIYPNPFVEKTYVEFFNEAPANVIVTVYDLIGRQIFQKKQKIQSGISVFELSGFSTGNYQIIISSNSWQKTASFVSLHTGVANPQIQFKSVSIHEQKPKSIEKNAKNIVQMPYTFGDQMLYIGFSDIYSEDIIDVPTLTQTLNFEFSLSSCGGSYIDSRDSNQYATVRIGNQCWMKENVKYLPSVIGPTFGSMTNPYYYVYNYNGTEVSAAKATTFYSVYGVLYNWEASLTACPEGWHLPIDNEWKELEIEIGLTPYQANDINWRGTNQGSKLAGNDSLWYSDVLTNNIAFGEIDFVAIPGGIRSDYAAFYSLNFHSFMWTATISGSNGAFARYISYNHSEIGRSGYGRDFGFTVRCIKD
jgi:uncharacterized protein (TIGR02145 family)